MLQARDRLVVVATKVAGKLCSKRPTEKLSISRNINRIIFTPTFVQGYSRELEMESTRSRSPRKSARQKKAVQNLGLDVPDPYRDSSVTFSDPVDAKDIGGMLWAIQQGYSHIKKVSKSDAVKVLQHLKLNHNDYNDALGELVSTENPWGWLELFANKNGNLSSLSVKPKFSSVNPT